MTCSKTQNRIKWRALALGVALMSVGGAAYAQDAADGSTAADTSDDTTATPEAASEEGAPEPTPEPSATPEPSPPASSSESETPAVLAVTEIEAEAEVEAEVEDDSVGISLGVGLASIYNFRGYNTFQKNGQNDQNALFAPSVEWSIFNTGLALGYWGAYQLTGSNRVENVKTALGHEQDLYLSWSKDFADGLVGLSFAFTYYFYPFASDDPVTGAGTKNPSIIEPLVGISLSTVLDVGFTASYFHGIQDEIKGLRHAYFHLSLGKGFEFNDTFGMNIGAALGIKAWVEDNDDNVFDLAFDWSIPIALTDALSLEPGIHLAWSNFENVPAGNEYMVYWTTDIGASF